MTFIYNHKFMLLVLLSLAASMYFGRNVWQESRDYVRGQVKKAESE